MSRFFETYINSCEILIVDAVIEVNVILLEMYDIDVVLGMDWLFNHRVSMDYFTKEIVFSKQGYLELEIESDRRTLPSCVISALEAKRLL